MDDGTIGHAELELDGELVMLATPSLDYQGPKRHRQECEAADRWLDNPWVVDGVLVLVDDLDAHHDAGGRSGRERSSARSRRARRAGCTPPRISRATAGCSSSDEPRLPPEPGRRPVRGGLRAAALSRRSGLAGRDPGDGASSSSIRPSSRSGAGPRPTSSSTSRRTRRSRSPRPTAAASRRSTARASSSATRSST